VVKLRLHSAGDASPLPPQRAGKRALGAPGLTALLLPHIFPIRHPTVHKTHGGDPRSAVVAPLRRGPHGADCAPWGGSAGRLAALGATPDFHHGRQGSRPFIHGCDERLRDNPSPTRLTDHVVIRMNRPGATASHGSVASDDCA
jgi:hypothetical protein